jgi:hypothetical protein
MVSRGKQVPGLLGGSGTVDRQPILLAEIFGFITVIFIEGKA